MRCYSLNRLIQERSNMIDWYPFIDRLFVLPVQTNIICLTTDPPTRSLHDDAQILPKNPITFWPVRIMFASNTTTCGKKRGKKNLYFEQLYCWHACKPRIVPRQEGSYLTIHVHTYMWTPTPRAVYIKMQNTAMPKVAIRERIRSKSLPQSLQRLRKCNNPQTSPPLQTDTRIRDRRTPSIIPLSEHPLQIPWYPFQHDRRYWHKRAVFHAGC